MKLEELIEFLDYYNLNFKSIPEDQKHLIYSTLKKDQSVEDIFTNVYNNDFRNKTTHSKEELYIHVYYLYVDSKIGKTYEYELLNFILHMKNKPLLFSFLMAEIKFSFRQKDFDKVNYLADFLFSKNIFNNISFIDNKFLNEVFEIFIVSVTVAYNSYKDSNIYNYHEAIKNKFTKSQNDFFELYMKGKKEYILIA